MGDSYRLVDLSAEDPVSILQAATLLRDGFRGRTDDWQTMESAHEEVLDSLSGNRLSRVALDVEGTVVGWIGAIPLDHYQGGVWELHPLVVDARLQRRGVGRLLVTDLEVRLRTLGCRTVYLGTDDENFETSLGGADLYADLPRALQNIENPGGHPYEFYQRLGYTIVGVLPDANGPGKPDIFMAKRL